MERFGSGKKTDRMLKNNFNNQTQDSPLNRTDINNYMNKLLIGSALVWIMIVLVACSEIAPPTPSNPAINKYFSLKQFFDTEIQSLQSQQIVLHKFATLNGETEKKALSEIDWKTEFTPFINSDINKPAWKDSYRIDSTASQFGELKIVYTANNPDLRTQEIVVTFEKDAITPKEIRITNQTQNPIYDTTEKLQYVVGKTYLIENQQKVMWMESDNFKIEGELIYHRGN